MNTIEVSAVARYLNWHYMTQGYYVEDLFQSFSGGSDCSIGKVLNLITIIPRVQSSIPAISHITNLNAIDVSAIVIML